MDKEWTVHGVSLSHIYNKNEEHVAYLMSEVLQEYPDYDPSTVDIEDIFALTLNSIPPRYMQFGSDFTVSEDDGAGEKVREQIRRSINIVISNPR